MLLAIASVTISAAMAAIPSVNPNWSSLCMADASQRLARICSKSFAMMEVMVMPLYESIKYWSFPFLCMGMVNPDFIMGGIWRARIIDVETMASTGAMMDELYLRWSSNRPIFVSSFTGVKFSDGI